MLGQQQQPKEVQSCSGGNSMAVGVLGQQLHGSCSGEREWHRNAVADAIAAAEGLGKGEGL